jgi:hypothetical protein
MALSGGVLKNVVIYFVYLAVWLFLSCSVIVYNKYIMDRKLYGWPFPISLTMIHMAFYSTLAFLLVRVFKVELLRLWFQVEAAESAAFFCR